MRRIILLLMLAVAALTASAQGYRDVVYLKNGSVVRGLIVEQVPNESLRIQMADGSVFAYKMKDVERIAKEFYDERRPYPGHDDRWNRSDFRGWRDTWQRQRGYRGFIDAGYTVGVGDTAEGRFEVSTSHGYQLCPYLFIGGGVSFQYFHSDEVLEIPVYAHLRSELTRSRIAPTVDLRVGYTLYDAKGFYINPSVGFRAAMGSRAGFSLSVGYTLHLLESEYNYGGYWDSATENVGGITFRLGFDF